MFWKELTKPIIAQAPMDGVTDAAFRFITDTYGHPSILFTEFTTVEGIMHNAVKPLRAFIHHKTETPTVAQIFGGDQEKFYKVAFVAAEMGFDGVDINMGCPFKHITKGGAGAGLILQPKMAQNIVRSTQQGLKDWSEGKKIEDADLPKEIIEYVKNYQKVNNLKVTRYQLPVSVKTRVGYDKLVTTDWIGALLETELNAISLHGRTLKQMYTGDANWEEIAKAAELVHKTDTLILGNGDVKSKKDAEMKIKDFGVDGVLIGRASFGNPWIFAGVDASWQEHLKVALEHCRKFDELLPDMPFFPLRKHLAWYCKGFDHAAEVRVRLLQTNSTGEVEKILSEYI
ncbi:MAG: tRNA-dihydrouridine synthase [Patescibacteria group bacterium]|jgi:tRNA-dihydrouridine synthase